MKFRIVEESYGSHTKYYPQVKILFWWKNLTDDGVLLTTAEGIINEIISRKSKRKVKTVIKQYSYDENANETKSVDCKIVLSEEVIK